LPDNIANQIAAGEVIQRPASAVKELLENAVDAGATEIRLFIADAGKALIQVIDNGKGMSETDARMAFERHATSKINDINDLFHIRTMGFRGEALASIAAVALVELKTRKAEEELGTFLEIADSQVIKQEPIACQPGSNLSMKNLFFNIPARRNFLKSNAAELRHIVDEFIRVALAFPEIFFSLSNNAQEMMHLEKGTLKQRILQTLGSSHNAKLVSVQENTDYLNIYGFVGKPETAKKTRGDQYFFVNNRFIRSAYLNHAVMNAYQEMIPRDSFPLYCLFIDLDPSQIDINVHPTKQEIKFEDEKIIYAFVQAAVKHALAQFSITPTLDFDLDPSIQGLEAVSQPLTEEKKAAITSSSLYQTFTKKNQAHFIETDETTNNTRREAHNRDFEGDPDNNDAGSNDTDANNESGYKGGPNSGNLIRLKDHLENWAAQGTPQDREVLKTLPVEGAALSQMLNTYIITPTNRGLMMINQQAAHERILYEQYSAAAAGKVIPSQQSLFPVTLQLATQDAILLTELTKDLHSLGYLVEPFGKDSFIIQGTPAGMGQGNERGALENLLEQFKNFSSEFKFSKREKLIRSLARQHAIKTGSALDEMEMRSLVTALFDCSQPNSTPGGDPTYVEFRKDYLQKLFTK
jgi:DNA mismatch repair protein MutL